MTDPAPPAQVSTHSDDVYRQYARLVLRRAAGVASIDVECLADAFGISGDLLSDMTARQRFGPVTEAGSTRRYVSARGVEQYLRGRARPAPVRVVELVESTARRYPEHVVAAWVAGLQAGLAAT